MSKDNIPNLPKTPKKKTPNETSKILILMKEMLESAGHMNSETQELLTSAQKIYANTIGASHLLEKHDSQLLVWQYHLFEDIETILGNKFYNEFRKSINLDIGSPASFIKEFTPANFEKIFLIVLYQTLKNTSERVTKIKLVNILSRLSIYLRVVYRIDATKTERLIERLSM